MECSNLTEDRVAGCMSGVVLLENTVDLNRGDFSISIYGSRSSLLEKEIVPSDFSDSLNDVLDADHFLWRDLFDLRFQRFIDVSNHIINSSISEISPPRSELSLFYREPWGWIEDPLPNTAVSQVELIKASWRRGRVTRTRQSLVSGSDTDRFKPSLDIRERVLIRKELSGILFSDAHVTCVCSHHVDSRKIFVRNVL